MRTATLVLVAYVLCVVVAASWLALPHALRDAIPDIGALTAAYLGLTARRDVAPAVGGSIALGYLVDLVSGSPAGLAALVLGLTCLVARAVQQRIYVRGTTMTIAFSAFVSIVTSLAAIVVRALYGMPRASWSVELRHLALVAIATAAIGPLVWRVFRRIDAAYARTHRDREAALEGIR
ncbi:MAG TPA: rod shape-determining protein MreD [Kofleriaceae bacterium]|jgi:rod shape-determining protein MreD